MAEDEKDGVQQCHGNHICSLTMNFIPASKGCFSFLLSFGSDTPAALALISMQLVAPLKNPTILASSENNTDIKKKKSAEQVLLSSCVQHYNHASHCQ